MVASFVKDLDVCVQSIPGVLALSIHTAPELLSAPRHAFLLGKERALDHDAVSSRRKVAACGSPSGATRFFLRRSLLATLDIFVDVSMDASPDTIRAVGESDLLAIARVARS